MPPELENLLRQVQIDGTLNAKEFVSSIFFTEESDYIKDFRNEFKNKFVQPLTRKLKNINSEDIKRIVDPLGVSDISDDLAEDFKKYRKKLKDFLNIDFPEINDEDAKEKLKDTSVGEALPDRVKEVETANVEEQKTLGPKDTIIGLNEETKDFFLYLFDKISGEERYGRDNAKKMEQYYEQLLEKQDELISLSEGSGILGTLAKVLAIGGVGALLLSTFWDSHIKPWLEETFDINLDFFDKFEGLVEGIGKFFTLGAGGIGGLLLKIQGKVFTSIADLLDNSIGSVLKGIFGETAAGGAGKVVAGGAKLFTGSFFARLAGNLFKGLSIVAFKGIPVIGALISWYFAYDRFQKGDYVGSVIDIVGGLANILTFTPLAPLALPLSLGAAALNAFLDIKYGGTGDGASESKAKLGFFSNIGTAVYNMVKKIPFIGGLIESVEGFGVFIKSLITGDYSNVKKGLEMMTGLPLFGVLPSILLAFLDVTDTSNADGRGSTMNLPNFLQAFKKRVGQTVLKWFSWLPTSWQKSIADFMGVPFNGIDENDSDVSSQQTHKQTMDQLRDTEVNKENIDIAFKNRDTAIKEYEEAVRKREMEDSIIGKYVTGKYEIYEKMANNLADEIQALNQKILEYQKENQSYSEDENNRKISEKIDQMRRDLKSNEETSEKIPEINVKDFYKPASGKTTSIFDEETKTNFRASPNDDVIAMQPNGIFDKSLKEIKTAIMEMNRNIVLVGKGLSENKTVNNSSINVSSGVQSNKEYLFENTRDPIFSERTNWWNLSQRVRSTV